MTQNQIFELVRKEVVIGEAQDMGAIEARADRGKRAEATARKGGSVAEATLESLTIKKKDKQTKRKGKKGRDDKLVKDIVKRL
jgi:hypothetical protein